MFTYQLTGRFFAQIDEGLESLGAEELSQLGAEDIKTTYRGVFFSAELDTVYHIVYCSRIFTRILAPLIRFDCHSDKYLYKTAQNINWADLFSLENTFAVQANVSHSKIKHSHFAALRLKDSIVDQFRDQFDERPAIDTNEPDVQLYIYVHNNKATIYLDLYGGSMHRRGYRLTGGQAPMQETLAAAIIRHTGWQGERSLVDPMCGAGTFLAEALMLYCKVPAGFLRKRFGFMFLPDYQRVKWQEVRKKLDSTIKNLPKDLIRGSDISSDATKMAKKNLSMLPGGLKIQVIQQGYNEIPHIENSTIVCNPPYGLRMGDSKKISDLVKNLGDFLKHRCKGSTAYIYFGDRKLLKNVGLRTSWKKPLRTGGLDGRLAKYELY